jgi:hypothetical protein
MTWFRGLPRNAIMSGGELRTFSSLGPKCDEMWELIFSKGCFKTYVRNWKAMRVVKDIKPRTRLVPLTIPASVLPRATFKSQSKSVTGATQRFDERRR